MVRSGIYARPDGFQRSIGNSCGCKTASTWFPAKERGVATGVFNMGTSLGAMLAPPLIARCIMFHSWQFAFIVSGSLALLAALFWFFVIKIQKMLNAFLMKSATILSLGKNSILKQIRKKTSIKHILSQRNFWGLASRVFSLTRHGEPLTSGYRFSSSKRCILA